MKQFRTWRRVAVGALVVAAVQTGAVLADEGADSVSTKSKEHQAIMNSGKTTHEDAWSATNDDSASGGKRAQANAAEHKRIMQSGRTHDEAWKAAKKSASAEEAKRLSAAAKRHQELMNQGKPHEQAWQATDAEQRK